MRINASDKDLPVIGQILHVIPYPYNWVFQLMAFAQPFSSQKGHNNDNNLHFMSSVDRNFKYDLHFLLNFVGVSLDPGTKPVFAGYM